MAKFIEKELAKEQADSKIKFRYDRRYDCLYALLSQDEGNHYGEELSPTIWVYRDTLTDIAVGFCIEEYSRRYKPRMKSPIPDFANIILPDPKTLYIKIGMDSG